MRKKPSNPFVLAGYVGKDYFCDREEELKTLIDHHINGRNVVIYSWRRLGKSALIQRYFKEGERNNSFEAIYIDLMATSGIDQAIDAIITAVYERFGKTNSGFSAAFQKLIGSLGASISFDMMTGLPNFSIDVHQPQQTKSSLHKIGTFLSERKKQVVIALDEFQQITHFDPAENTEAVFRSFMQEHPHLRFIFSGSYRSMMTRMFTQRSRPFYKSCQMIALAPVPLGDYLRFTQRHFRRAGMDISGDLIEDIYTWSKGQTYTIQLTLNMLYARGSTPTHRSLEAVRRSILQQEAPVFAQYGKLLTKTQWQVLLAIGKEGEAKNPLSKAFIKKYDLGAASSVSTALKALSEREIIAHEEGHYFVHEVLLGRWIQSLPYS